MGVATTLIGVLPTLRSNPEKVWRSWRRMRWARRGWPACFEQFAKVKAEPALVLSVPDKPSEDDNGLLTASEIAMLKLNADFVVLSACNTAAEEKPGAEALSGLARAFFYAGAKSQVVSYWEVDSEATVALMDGLFEALKAIPRLSHAEALRMSMLRIIANSSKPELAQPKFLACQLLPAGVGTQLNSVAQRLWQRRRQLRLDRPRPGSAAHSSSVQGRLGWRH